MGKTVELDVRPHLRKKLEPFQIIMETVKKLEKDDTFLLHATFKPTPLLGLMKTKGYHNKCTKVADDHWTVTFVHRSMKHLLEDEAFPSAQDEANVEAGSSNSEPQVYKLDNRGLEPPQPMVRTLAKLDKASPGDQVIIHNDRVPMFLIEELNMLGYPYEIDQQEDGSAIVTITKK